MSPQDLAELRQLADEIYDIAKRSRRAETGETMAIMVRVSSIHGILTRIETGDASVRSHVLVDDHAIRRGRRLPDGDL